MLQQKDGLKLLKNDKDIVRFTNEFSGQAHVEFYLKSANVDDIDCRMIAMLKK